MEYIDIFDQINKYYPIGIDIFNPAYKDHLGYKSLIKLVENNLSSAYFNKWKSFIASFKLVFPEIKSIRPESMLADTCYTGELIINSITANGIHYKKKLMIHLSFIDSLFTIYGKDEISIDDSCAKARVLIFDPVITISPVRVYDKYFSRIRIEMQKHFPQSRFVPYFLLRQRVAGLITDTSDLKMNQYSSVFQALFTGENLTDYRTEGDLFYE